MTDLTAKAQRAAEWWNRAKAKDLAYCSEGTGWIVIEDAKRWCAYDRISDNVFIAFCEDRGWQDQDTKPPEFVGFKGVESATFNQGQEADGVEWAIEGEWAVTNTGTWLNVSHRAASNWEWEAWAPCVDTITGTAPTREEARRQAVEAARGMG